MNEDTDLFLTYLVAYNNAEGGTIVYEAEKFVTPCPVALQPQECAPLPCGSKNRGDPQEAASTMNCLDEKMLW